MQLPQSLQSLSFMPVDIIRIIDKSSTVPDDRISFEVKTTTDDADQIDCSGDFVVQGREYTIRVYSRGSFSHSFGTTNNIHRLFLYNKHIIVFGKNQVDSNFLSIYTLHGNSVASFPVQLFDGYKVILNGAFDGVNTIVYHAQDWMSNTHVYHYSLDGKVVGHYSLTERFNTIHIDSNLNLIAVLEKQTTNLRYLPIDQSKISLFHVSTFDSTGKLMSTRRFGPVCSYNLRHNGISRGNARAYLEYSETLERKTTGLYSYQHNLWKSSNIFIVRDHLCAYQETKTGFNLFRLNEWKLSPELWDKFWNESAEYVKGDVHNVQEIVYAAENEKSLVRQHETFTLSARFFNEIFIDSSGFICFKVADHGTIQSFRTSFTCFKIWL